MKFVNNLYFFLSGVMIAFDFSGMIGRNILTNDVQRAKKSDMENIASDWIKVGDTLQEVMDAQQK